jgi:hypothetical protein
MVYYVLCGIKYEGVSVQEYATLTEAEEAAAEKQMYDQGDMFSLQIIAGTVVKTY